MPKDILSGQWSGSGKNIFRDITGQRFGHLVVLKATDERRSGHIAWLCRCDCGTEKLISGKKLRTGNTVSCGCKRNDGHSTRTHGATSGQEETVEYRTWKSMLARCRNPHNKAFPYYGGRGIKVCERWNKFENFFSDMGPRPDGYSIERVDNNGNYEPSNCKWIPMQENRKHQRKGSHDD